MHANAQKTRELHHALFRQEIPWGVWRSGRVEHSPYGVLEVARCEIRDGFRGFSGRRVDACVGEVFCSGGGGRVTGQKGTGRMEGFACGSQELGNLTTHAGSDNTQ